MPESMQKQLNAVLEKFQRGEISQQEALAQILVISWEFYRG